MVNRHCRTNTLLLDWCCFILVCMSFALEAVCGAVEPGPSVTDPPPLRWFRVYGGAVHGTVGAHNASASTQAEWDSLKQRMEADGANFYPSIGVDFSKEMIIFVALGSKGSGGYQLSLTALRELPEEVVVFVTETDPGGPHCAVTSIISYPALVAVIPKTSKPLNFSITKVRPVACL